MVIALFYGGRSCEHEVSIATGKQIYSLIKNHTVVPIYVTEEGKWTAVSDISAKFGKRVFISPGDDRLRIGRFKRVRPDVAVICLHGAGGEDGSIQGLLQSCGIAYTGSGIAASAIGLDKSLSKKAFAVAGLPVIDYFDVRKNEYEREVERVLERAERLGYPLIVKPACLGSSIGIAKVHDGRELVRALAAAFNWDGAAVVEKAIERFAELNCAVLSGKPSEVEKPARLDEILSYADKYERGSFKGLGREFPAVVDEKIYKSVQSYAVAAYNAIGASGIARVDFIYDETEEKLYVNEINTVPGSLALYMFGGAEGNGKSGYLSGEALGEAIARAEAERAEREGRKYRYVSAGKIIDGTSK